MSRLRELVDRANTLWAPQERPFTSSTPVVGPIIVSMRRAWNWMSAKWYVRPILQQQIEFNLTIVQVINEMCTVLEQQQALVLEHRQVLAKQILEAEQMIIAADRSHTSLVKEVARLRHRLNQISGTDSSDISALKESVRRLEEVLEAGTATKGKDANSLL